MINIICLYSSPMLYLPINKSYYIVKEGIKMSVESLDEQLKFVNIGRSLTLHFLGQNKEANFINQVNL